MNSKPMIASAGAWMSIITTIVGILTVVQNLIPKEQAGWGMIIAGVLWFLNRFLTVTPIKGSPKAK